MAEDIFTQLPFAKKNFRTRRGHRFDGSTEDRRDRTSLRVLNQATWPIRQFPVASIISCWKELLVLLELSRRHTSLEQFIDLRLTFFLATRGDQ